MIEVRPATLDNLPQITELLHNANDTPYDLVKVTEEKCFGAGLAGPPRTLLAVDDELPLGVAVICGRALRLLAVHRHHRRKSVGSLLLREAEKTIGGSRVDVGAEPGNYFVPGVPATDDGMRRFFHLHGYRQMPEEAVDLSVPLSGNPLIPERTEARRATAPDRDRVLTFIETAFARAWRLEAERAFDHEDPTLFIAENDGRIVGFSAHDANNRGLGFFGPEGVLPEHRGRGIGGGLLLASLADLRRMGFERAIIAWAASHDFYRRVCGAEIAQRFIRYRKRFEP